MSIKLVECGEKLVPASLYPEKILVQSWYFGEGLSGSVPEVWLREGVYERLLTASDNLPKNLRFVLWDGWRSYELQKNLYDTLTRRIMARGIPEHEAKEQAKIFVAFPSKEPDLVSGHLTGGAVDLTLADMRGHYLDMGGEFDETEEHSHTDYYSKAENFNAVADGNRNILRSVMENAGFSNYPCEWWHYNFGNRQWAEYTGKNFAIYGYTEPPFKWRK